MKDEKEKSGKLNWEELVFGTIEKIAAVPSKLKDPKESASQAVEWVKGLRDDLQERMTREIMSRIRELDWDALTRKVAEQIAENYDVDVKISFKPKTGRKKPHGHKAETSDSENPSE
jgi:hypothetical protein